MIIANCFWMYFQLPGRYFQVFVINMGKPGMCVGVKYYEGIYLASFGIGVYYGSVGFICFHQAAIFERKFCNSANNSSFKSISLAFNKMAVVKSKFSIAVCVYTKWFAKSMPFA